MDITVNLDHNREVDKIKFQKMIFLYNALDNGWSIKKRKNSYIFSKNHEGKKEIFDESYLSIFINISILVFPGLSSINTHSYTFVFIAFLENT